MSCCALLNCQLSSLCCGVRYLKAIWQAVDDASSAMPAPQDVEEKDLLGELALKDLVSRTPSSFNISTDCNVVLPMNAVM